MRASPNPPQAVQESRELLENIADNLKKRRVGFGGVAALDTGGRTIWIVDAHAGDGKRVVVRIGYPADGR